MVSSDAVFSVIIPQGRCFGTPVSSAFSLPGVIRYNHQPFYHKSRVVIQPAPRSTKTQLFLFPKCHFPLKAPSTPLTF